ncbi:RNA polymerase sigma factor [Pyxidicoccus sp. MSG2]|uniref:RNA polymerase sigma factor n=1 Tax=Pyxidicoccus sp. MSG2 TaxID=2996790 RepID=UPI00226E979E|nr:RNA polymerase sigma factor [Pyxidicoccus sp. MSG2]MCY1018625.1 RNA polymerase sigma factor [Pyxidicoccus sp. MSG2]
MDPQLESFIVEIRPWLYRQAYNICRDRADAEDLVQEGSERFLKSFASLSRLPAENELERWLITAMANCFIDLCRKRKSEKQGAVDPTLERLTVGQPSDPPRLSDTISDEDFAAVMKKLSPALRKTLELRLAGKRYHEIAEVERIPIGAVGKRLSDARKKLLRLLAPFLAPGDH